MLIKRPNDIKASEITTESQYLQRRQILLRAGALAATGSILLACENEATGNASNVASLSTTDEKMPVKQLQGVIESPLSTADEPLTSFEDITSYNNFYEFGTGKSDPAHESKGFVTRPWSIEVSGECEQPGTFDLEDFIKPHQLEERIYRLRCVEAWSMVVPWVGISLNSVLGSFKPTSKAKYVAFQTLLDPKRMPGQQYSVLDWPYVEGLRIDEAMHPLSILVVGLYGRELPNQNGAPLRLMVPWKYGFKSIKSIVKIRFTEKQPPASWNISAPREYGFYSNVNPEVSHPRWSQAKERRIGDFYKRDTLMFNGYADQVASLYAGMDLKKFY